MLERWERIYTIFFYGLLVAVAALFAWQLIPALWNAVVHSGWRPRAAFGLLIGWYIIMRLVTKSAGFRAHVSDWQTRSLLHMMCFHLLFMASPMGVALYLVPVHDPGEMLVSIIMMSVLFSVVVWRARPTISRS
jgi:hypothetical protein